MNLHIQRHGPVQTGGSERAEAGPVQARAAAAAGPGDFPLTPEIFTDGFFVAVGDGTRQHALAQQAVVNHQAMASVLGRTLLAAERLAQASLDLAQTEGPSAPPHAAAVQVADATARQEESLLAALQSAFGASAGHAREGLPGSRPHLVDQGGAAGARVMPGAALPWVVSGAVHVGIAMRSHIEGLLQRNPPPSLGEGTPR